MLKLLKQICIEYVPVHAAVAKWPGHYYTHIVLQFTTHVIIPIAHNHTIWNNKLFCPMRIDLNLCMQL